MVSCPLLLARLQETVKCNIHRFYSWKCFEQHKLLSLSHYCEEPIRELDQTVVVFSFPACQAAMMTIKIGVLSELLYLSKFLARSIITRGPDFRVEGIAVVQ